MSTKKDNAGCHTSDSLEEIFQCGLAPSSALISLIKSAIFSVPLLPILRGFHLAWRNDVVGLRRALGGVGQSRFGWDSGESPLRFVGLDGKSSGSES